MRKLRLRKCKIKFDRCVNRFLPEEILGYFPEAKMYVEPFFSYNGLFLLKRPNPVEVVNDAYGELYNLFRFLREPETRKQLVHRFIVSVFIPNFIERNQFRFVTPLSSTPDYERAELLYCWLGNILYRHFERNKNKGYGNIIGAISYSRWIYLQMIPEILRWRFLMPQIDNVDPIEALNYWIVDNEEKDAVTYIDLTSSFGLYDLDSLLGSLLKIKCNAFLHCIWSEDYIKLLRSGWSHLGQNETQLSMFAPEVSDTIVLVHYASQT